MDQRLTPLTRDQRPGFKVFTVRNTLRPMSLKPAFDEIVVAAVPTAFQQLRQAIRLFH
jgi:hypothetical protein